TTLARADGSGLLFGGIAVGGLAVDAIHDLLYIASSKHVIYQVSPSPSPSPIVFAGTLNTPGSADTATGPGTNASFNGPSGLAFDGTHLFVADSRNNTIRRIDVASGVTSTLAGSVGAADESDGVGAAAH